MYTPQSFRVEDPGLARSFVEENGFAILLSSVDGSSIQDTHVPLLVSEDGDFLLGHMARANDHWKAWQDNNRVKAVFHGPHCYVSPSYYRSDRNVPTWNYTAVSMSGEIEIVDALEEQQGIMRALVRKYEAPYEDSWEIDETAEDLPKFFSAVVFFRIRILETQAKFKLNQNKSREGQESVALRLFQNSSASDRAVGAMMKVRLEDV